MDDLKDLETPASGAGSGPSSSNMGASGAGGQGRGGTSGLQYSIPGILHFLQHEWARFEMERGQWEVEKAELQVTPQNQDDKAKNLLKPKSSLKIKKRNVFTCN